MSKRPPLPPEPFDEFFNYEQTIAYCEKLAAAQPDLLTLSALGSSRQGRDIPLLVITDPATGPAENKPGYLIHAVIHADELTGINMALHNARSLLADHSKKPDTLRHLAFYILPTLNPDNADLAANLSMSLRSRTDFENRQPNTIYQEDLNGDGVIVRMRQEHPDGDHMQDPKDPRLVIPREHGGKGPYYRIFPEGLIHDWDGDVHSIKPARGYDWNRQWPYDWRPEPEQRGAGEYPFSEPEMQLLARFIADQTNLAGLVGYHTGAASILRPPSAGSVRDMINADHEACHAIGSFGERVSGFPLYPLSEIHPKWAPPSNFRGHSLSYAYYHLGLLAFEIELGVLMDSAGFGREAMQQCRTESDKIEILRKTLKWWDKQPQAKTTRVWVDWEPFDHPQLGKVEIGGYLPRNLYNQALPSLKQLAPGLHEFVVEHASWSPRLVAEQVELEPMDGKVHRIRMNLVNRGRLPTSITEKGKSLSRHKPVRASLRLNDGVTLLSRQGHQQVGHLAPLVGAAHLEWFVSIDRKQEGDSVGHVEIRGGAAGDLTVPV